MMNTIITQWQTGIGEIHFLLAIGVFFIVNFIGSRTYSIGYIPISLLVKEESSLAFNFVLRVLTPIVYLMVTASIIYYVKADFLISHFYLVGVYYLIVRYFVNFLQGRLGLLNWGRQLIYSGSILILSYFVYDKFISHKQNLLPDFNNVANELWIIIILFVYKIVNELEVSLEGSTKRKTNYIDQRFLEFREKYGGIVDSKLDNDVLKAVVYGIMIYENFNRSKIVRIVENVSFFISGKPHSLGIMQVTTGNFLNDKASVALGSMKVREDYEKYLNAIQSRDRSYEEFYEPEERNSSRTQAAYYDIISNYNTGQEYLDEVQGIVSRLLEKHYAKTTDTLDPVVEAPWS